MMTSVTKIKDILDELKLHELEIQKLSDPVNDKQCKYLDEMLTRCLLRLDGIDVMGSDEVRTLRKRAIKSVQACIDCLETKIHVSNKFITQKDKYDPAEVCIEISKDMNKTKIGVVEFISSNVNLVSQSFLELAFNSMSALFSSLRLCGLRRYK